VDHSIPVLGHGASIGRSQVLGHGAAEGRWWAGEWFLVRWTLSSASAVPPWFAERRSQSLFTLTVLFVLPDRRLDTGAWGCRMAFGCLSGRDVLVRRFRHSGRIETIRPFRDVLLGGRSSSASACWVEPSVVYRTSG